MTIDDFDLEENTVFLEPRNIFDSGIVGVTTESRIVYSYEKLAEKLAMTDYKDEEYPYETACEFLDYNTVRSVEYNTHSKNRFAISRYHS